LREVSNPFGPARRAPRAAPRGFRSWVALRQVVGPLAFGAIVGCGSTTPRPAVPDVDLHHPSATRRLEAVTVTAKQRDLAQVPTLIDRLDDEDPAVRLMAGSTLVSLTGHDTGYRPYASSEERQRQQATWRAWWSSQGHGAAPAAPSPSPAGTRAPTPVGSAPRAGGAGYTQGATHGGPP